jgi:hypothetical protein
MKLYANRNGSPQRRRSANRQAARWQQTRALLLEH